MKTNLLWDLDGTLTDPKLGIIRCIQHALKSGGYHAPEQADLLWCIGPPLHESFLQLVPNSTETHAWELVAKYRERFAEVGMFENELCSGIVDLLASLKGKRNFVATSKPHIFATQIVSHFGLHPHFIKVYGSELDGTRADKSELIRYILDSEQIPRDDVVMIGDRKHDILGAKKVGIPSIGVTWGYGAKAELEEAGANQIFEDPAQLLAHLNQL